MPASPADELLSLAKRNRPTGRAVRAAALVLRQDGAQLVAWRPHLIVQPVPVLERQDPSWRGCAPPPERLGRLPGLKARRATLVS